MYKISLNRVISFAELQVTTGTENSLGMNPNRPDYLLTGTILRDK
jgi:hypothetical protein